MTRVLPNLYLGNELASKTIGRDVGLVVNCTSNLPFHGDPTTQTQMRVPVEDNGDDSQQDAMFAHLTAQPSSVIEEIHSTLLRGVDVLVHCRAGQQRSATVVAAYVMSLIECSAADAIEFVRSRKRDAFLGGHVNFHRALEKFEKFV